MHVTTYVVQPGDTTGAIAEYFYGDQTEAEVIAHYNRLSNVNRISVGQQLDVPFYNWDTWRQYTERTGQVPELEPGKAVSGGSEDVAVARTSQDGGNARSSVFAITVYGGTVIAISLLLYYRSRRHEYRALGMGAPRR